MTDFRSLLRNLQFPTCHSVSQLWAFVDTVSSSGNILLPSHCWPKLWSLYLLSSPPPPVLLLMASCSFHCTPVWYYITRVPFTGEEWSQPTCAVILRGSWGIPTLQVRKLNWVCHGSHILTKVHASLLPIPGFVCFRIWYLVNIKLWETVEELDNTKNYFGAIFFPLVH